MSLSIHLVFFVMFQRLCDSAAKLGSAGDVAGTKPILKELQAVLQR